MEKHEDRAESGLQDQTHNEGGRTNTSSAEAWLIFASVLCDDPSLRQRDSRCNMYLEKFNIYEWCWKDRGGSSRLSGQGSGSAAHALGGPGGLSKRGMPQMP